MHKRAPLSRIAGARSLVLPLGLLLLAASLFIQSGGKVTTASAAAGNLWNGFASKAHPPEFYGGKTLQSVQFACQQSNSPDYCYTPNQIEKAYNYVPLYQRGIRGQGRTIVIMDFSQSPTIAKDLKAFDKLFGLPDPRLNIIAPFGVDPADSGVATEITLDVEYAHAAAPNATIDLVLVSGAPAAKTVSDLYHDFLRGVSYAINKRLGDVISMSYGFPELCVNKSVQQESHQVFAAAAAAHITTIDSAGDTGATVPNCTFKDLFPFRATQFPAVEPTVLDVGGTFLDAKTAGNYKSETAWTQVSLHPDNGAGGGGISTIYAEPSYQKNAGINYPSGSPRGRVVPDVTYNADPRSGVIVLCSSCGSGANALLVVGGTSAGAPQWAGIIALGAQFAHKSLGFINQLLYQLYKSSHYHTAFHDIVTGNNTYTFTNASGNQVTVHGFTTNPGYDFVTGIGSPNVAQLTPLL